jgi:hypothetical protein
MVSSITKVGEIILISRRLIEKTLDESVKYFKEEILDFPTQVKIVYTTTEEWLESLIHSPMVQMQLEHNIYQNLEEEFPSFVYVTKFDNKAIDLMSELFNVPIKINVCYDIAKKRLRGFTEKEVTSYFQYIFNHELVHLKEDKLIEKYSDKWNQSLLRTQNHPILSKEDFAESFQTSLPNQKHVHKINKRLYRQFILNAEKITGRGVIF